mgnify:CR=1 FL=1
MPHTIARSTIARGVSRSSDPVEAVREGRSVAVVTSCPSSQPPKQVSGQSVMSLRQSGDPLVIGGISIRI